MITIDKYTEQARREIAKLKQATIDKGITYQAIADKTGWTQPNVSRILNGKYIPRYDSLLKLAAAIGAKVTIMIKK